MFSYDELREFESHKMGIKSFLEKDSPFYMNKLFEIYESKNWSKIVNNSFTIDRNLGISSTTCFSPFREKYVKWTHNNFEKPQPLISFSIVPEENRTSIAFVWLDEFNDFCGEFINIKKEQKNTLQKLNAYVFCESEDVCVRPSLWERLSQSDRFEIYKHMSNSESLVGADSVPLVFD